MIEVSGLLKLISVLLTGIFALMKSRFEAKPRLVTYCGHSSALVFPDGKLYGVHSVVVRNIGKRQATNLRVGHITPPQELDSSGERRTLYVYQVWPSIGFTEDTSPKQGFDLVFPSLAPNQQITLSYAYESPRLMNQVIGLIRSDEQVTTVINSIPAPQPSRVISAFVALTCVLGTATLIYSLLWLVWHVWNPTLLLSSISNG